MWRTAKLGQQKKITSFFTRGKLIGAGHKLRLKVTKPVVSEVS
jgi:hypothetical protein